MGRKGLLPLSCVPVHHPSVHLSPSALPCCLPSADWAQLATPGCVTQLRSTSFPAPLGQEGVGERKSLASGGVELAPGQD